MKIILEGLTGTGKTSTLSAMRRLALLPALVASEDETFGDVMEEVDAGPPDSAHLLRRLDAVRTRVVAESPDSFLLERFHLSYYALLPTWSLYEEIDRALADLGASIILLTVSDSHLRERALFRREYAGADWQDFAARFGSEENALLALRTSQERRIDALARSRMPSLVIDTTAEKWDEYAATIARVSSADPA